MQLFPSQYAPKLWDKLYNVIIPDVLTLEDDYIRTFGVRLSGDKKVDADVHKRKIHSMLNVIAIAHYFNEGIPVEFLHREDLATIYKDIVGYLGEWKEYLRTQINVNPAEYQELLDALDKFAAELYLRLNPREIKPDTPSFGLRRIFQKSEEASEKPPYEGIRELVEYTKGKRYFQR